MLRDVRYAIRRLLKSPGFSLVAIATLALGIGANTTIFSIINAVLLRPLPYPDANRIVTLSESTPQQLEISISWPNFLDWKTESTVFDSLAVGRRESFNLSGLEDRGPERISGFVVTAAFFKVIGLEPRIGRGAIAATRLLSSLLFATSATDPIAFASVAFLLVVVALLASYLPARRAMKIDPREALRYE